MRCGCRWLRKPNKEMMMQPITFEQMSIELQKPSGMTDEECGPLPVYKDPDGTFCVSCWKPTLRERLSILVFGKVWVWVHSGKTQPPIALEGYRDIFDGK
jgi:hypothetical protein